jgi:hypothetical protein
VVVEVEVEVVAVAVVVVVGLPLSDNGHLARQSQPNQSTRNSIQFNSIQFNSPESDPEHIPPLIDGYKDIRPWLFSLVCYTD